MSASFKLSVRRRICWSRRSTRPIPNSIAENTKKKKVRERMF